MFSWSTHEQLHITNSHNSSVKRTTRRIRMQILLKVDDEATKVSKIYLLTLSQTRWRRCFNFIYRHMGRLRTGGSLGPLVTFSLEMYGAFNANGNPWRKYYLLVISRYLNSEKVPLTAYVNSQNLICFSKLPKGLVLAQTV